MPNPTPDTATIQAADGNIVNRLRIEAAASKRLHPASAKNAIAAMREAAEVIEGLVGALDTLLPMCGAPHDFTIGDVWQAQEQARAALAHARGETP